MLSVNFYGDNSKVTVKVSKGGIKTNVGQVRTIEVIWDDNNKRVDSVAIAIYFLPTPPIKIYKYEE